MRETNKVFHLAIPCKELDETVEFYEKLGCKLARRYADRVTFDFFGDQVVCHLSPNHVDENPKMYPRHFGITFLAKEEYDKALQMAIKEDLPFFKEPMVRFAGRQEEHLTFFLLDPANNLLEFKYYHDASMAY
ncbi:glyoxalase [Virgibacillus dakarensis]|uniref:Glyoxalase n=1 Tax=Lentibacillus populi TaxID=1827502 RepID=A0A9W5TUL3_9BACI|nr:MULTISPECIES: VOC family protein [Bacillaceae]MBT2214957.1 VOC family protein [Virgibacillus dakarensis]MTW84831.1 glyoxalase [Virgibacillus dakarensis]GGB31471.1 glyoxalase [Lentibacillus populi]